MGRRNADGSRKPTGRRGSWIESAPPSKRTVADAQLACDRLLREMERQFTPECRLTLVMRSTTNPDAYMVLTRDPDLAEVVRILQAEGEPLALQPTAQGDSRG